MINWKKTSTFVPASTYVTQNIRTAFDLIVLFSRQEVEALCRLFKKLISSSNLNMLNGGSARGGKSIIAGSTGLAASNVGEVKITFSIVCVCITVHEQWSSFTRQELAI